MIHRRKTAISIMFGLSLLGIYGLFNMTYRVDPLDMLPQDHPITHGLTVFRKHFANNNESIVSLHATGTETPEQLAALAKSLAKKITDANIATKVEWQDSQQQSAQTLAEIAAFAWFNAPPDALAALQKRLAENSEQRLEESIEILQTSLDSTEIALHAYDPFALHTAPALAVFFEKMGQTGDGFASADGLYRIIRLTASKEIYGFKQFSKWQKNLENIVADWQKNDPSRQKIEIAYTGEIPFVAEIGTGMEADMTKSVGITSLMIALLFWILQRRILPLFWLLIVLALSFSVTLSIAALFWGELNMMSIGFAAILLGLVADYGVIISREAVVGGGNAGQIRAAIGRSVGWAAATSAAVFFALILSSFPGMAQLGVLVGMGLILGAVLMLLVFVPMVANRKNDQTKAAPDDGKIFSQSHHIGQILLVALLLFIGSVFIFKGIPKIDFGFQAMHMKGGKALPAFELLQKKMSNETQPGIFAIIEGKDDTELQQHAAEAKKLLEKAKEDGVVQSYQIADGLVPNPKNQQQNRQTIEKILAQRDALATAADDAGFEPESLEFTGWVFSAWEKITSDNKVVVAGNPQLTRAFLHRDESGGTLLGMVQTNDFLQIKEDGFTALDPYKTEGVSICSWDMMSAVIRPCLQLDARRVFLPMLAVLVTMLLIAFRDIRDVLLTLGVMCMSTAMLCVVLLLLGVQWNFMSISAVPLLLGCGLDYSIHIILALRREGGNLKKCWHNTGKALVFCGSSSAIGFTSLVFASNRGLISIGLVGSVGILLTMVLTVFFMPLWWRWIHHKKL